MNSYVFIAGGIGITPFRSMMMDLMHKKQTIDGILYYLAASESAVLFREVLSQAEKEIGLKVSYVRKDAGETLTIEQLEQIPDYQTKQYYISGSQSFVLAYQEILLQLEIPQSQIKIDSFTGYD